MLTYAQAKEFLFVTGMAADQGPLTEEEKRNFLNFIAMTAQKPLYMYQDFLAVPGIDPDMEEYVLVAIGTEAAPLSSPVAVSLTPEPDLGSDTGLGSGGSDSQENLPSGDSTTPPSGEDTGTGSEGSDSAPTQEAPQGDDTAAASTESPAPSSEDTPPTPPAAPQVDDTPSSESATEENDTPPADEDTSPQE